MKEPSDKIKALKNELASIKKSQAAYQFFMDEGIDIMSAIKEKMQFIVNQIKLHKFSIEDGKNIDDCNEKLWVILEDESLKDW